MMPVLKAEDVEAALRKGGPASVDVEVTARFKAGDRVVVRNINPLGYLADSYYERWLYGLEVLLEENGLVTSDEIAARMAELAEGDG